jgi:DMSO/TMAO reductase YedYZ molybdopterin-dependent catalytic subunit
MKFSLLRFTNIGLLFLTGVLGLTGAYSLIWTWQPWVFDLHRAAGVLLLALIPWKVGISWASLRRGGKKPASVGVSLLLAAVSLGVVGLGFAWYWRIGDPSGWLGQTVISWHWMIGLALAVPLAIHTWQRWPKPHRVDFASRRAFLRMGALTLVGLAGWGVGDWIANQRSLPADPRRFTGSRADGSRLGNVFPVTNNPGEDANPINPELWRLAVEQPGKAAHSHSYAELLVLSASQVTATVDCTLGWYSTHAWQGIPLRDLLDLSKPEALAEMGVLLESVSGYAHVIPFPEAAGILLATHVDGQALAPAHGYPLRAVVPSRRGWFWVKWLGRVALVSVET